MPKRAPTTTLTHDNWDKEEEEDDEPTGGMEVASEEQLKKRVIITAKRRNLNSQCNEKSIFSTFSGFGRPQTGDEDTKSNQLSLFGKTNDFPSTGRFTSFAKTNETSTEIDKNQSKMFKPNMETETTGLNGAVNGSKTVGTQNDAKKHQHRQLCKHLKVLNEAVLNWTQKHLKTNPYLDLTPVFQDYIKHYKDLEIKFGSAKTECSNKSTENGQNKVADGPIKAPFSFQSMPVESKAEFSSPPTASFSFGIKEKSNVSTPPTFSFGQQNETTNSDKTFSFSQTKPAAPSTFVFGASKVLENDQNETSKSTFGSFSSAENNRNQEETEKNDDNEEGEYHPPEPESVAIEEKDAFFTTKCKLFFKSGKQKDFRERGVGMLYLKPLESGKIQLLVRAETSLGNILLNVALSESMHCTRTGKNNVSFICVPNPPDARAYSSVDPNTPIMFLIRVKTAENADELLEKMTSKP